MSILFTNDQSAAAADQSTVIGFTFTFVDTFTALNVARGVKCGKYF